MADSRVRGRPAAKTRPQGRAGAALPLVEFYFQMQTTPKPRRAAGSVRGGVCTPGPRGLGLSPTNMFGAMQETQETEDRSLGQEGPLRRKWQPTLVFLPGESHGQRRLVGSSPWGCKESNVTE